MKKLFTFFTMFLTATFASAQCDYVINMQDSYGDGWDGSTVDVTVNGNTVANWGLTGTSGPSGSAGTDSISTISGDIVEFSFTNAGSNWDSEITFDITDPSGAVIYANGPAPSVGPFLTDTSNATCLPATVNVTFQVDMGLVTAGFTTPEVNGTWNSWCGNCNPMTDADGDGVWEATIPLSSGSYEYKYSADTWNIQEMNDPNASCTNGDPVNTNRVLTVGTSDMTISTVCWGSCSPCIYPGTCGIYTLELTDSYGDGWNGGSLDVVVNGTAVFSGLTIATGFGPEIYQIPVDIGDVVDFNYTAGSYSGENSYQVFDNNSVLIVDEGPGSSAPSSVTGVSACPACADPSGLTASNVTATSADLSWTAGGTETEWFLIVNGAGTTQTSTTANLTGLIPDSAYTAQVHAVCAPGDTSGASISVSFATPCAAVTAPYSQDFSSGTLPSCWNQSAASGDGWRYAGAPAYDAASNGRTSGTYAWIDFSGTDAGTVMDLVPVDVSALTVPELEFAYFSYDVTYGSTPANILYIESYDGSGWVVIDILADNTVPGWNYQRYDLTGYDVSGVASIRFRGESGGASGDYYNDILVDDVVVREQPSCYDPYGVSAVSLGSDSATIAWSSSDPSVTAWNYVLCIRSSWF